MKVLAIIGSPKKGNSYRVTEQVENRLKSYCSNDATGKKDLEFDYLFLKDANLELCKGCFACIPYGADKCPLNDSRADIEKQILDYDGVILASPVYAMNVPWLMKNFMDRFSYTLHRPVFLNQKLMLLVTAGDVGIKETQKTLSSTLGGMDLVAKLGVKTPPLKYRPKFEQKVANDIDKASKKFYQSLKSGKPLPASFVNVLWFQIFKIQSEKTRYHYPADYEYYKDKKTFFYETKVSPLKTSVARLLIRLVTRSFDKNYEVKTKP